MMISLGCICSFTRVLFHTPSITIASLSSSPLAIAIAIVVIIITIGHRRHRHRTSPSPWSSPSPSPSIVIVGDVPCNYAELASRKASARSWRPEMLQHKLKPPGGREGGRRERGVGARLALATRGRPLQRVGPPMDRLLMDGGGLAVAAWRDGGGARWRHQQQPSPVPSPTPAPAPASPTRVEALADAAAASAAAAARYCEQIARLNRLLDVTRERAALEQQLQQNQREVQLLKERQRQQQQQQQHKSAAAAVAPTPAEALGPSITEQLRRSLELDLRKEIIETCDVLSKAYSGAAEPAALTAA